MNIMFGKSPVRVDSRTLKMRALLKPQLPPIPATYDVDSQFPMLSDNAPFLNDTHPDCVIAQHAHQLLRFECFEQRTLITIQDAEVKAEYDKETGGSESNLNMLDSLKIWRKDGFLIGGKLYKIHAFATFDWKNHNDAMAAIYLFNGVAVGLSLPNSAVKQYKENQPWTVVADDGGKVNGHTVYALKYSQIADFNETGPTFLTWGRYVQATWEFWDKYVDEAYAIVDERDDWVTQTNDPLNITALQRYLGAIGNIAPEPQQLDVLTTSLPDASIAKSYSAQLNASGGVPPYSWSIDRKDTLPLGLKLFGGGQLIGKPTHAGIYCANYSVTDSAGSNKSKTLSLKVAK